MVNHNVMRTSLDIKTFASRPPRDAIGCLMDEVVTDLDVG